jgi:glucose/arabinose dehydrogenase
MVLACALLAVACGSQGPSTSPGTTGVAAPTRTPSAAPGASATGSSPIEPPPGTGGHPDLAGVHVTTETIAGGLTAPLWVTAVTDDTGRLFVAEQGGRIRIIDNGQLLPTPYLDISDRVLAGGERGLLGVAFPPSFGDARATFYVHYSDHDGNTTVSSFEAPSGGADTVDPSTERTVLTQQQPYANHNGGWIGFDPDGMLLIALGDGGSGGDPQNHASSLDTLLGKILRIDVLGATADAPYLIPADNPFVGRTGARPEILHYGLRNPFRDSIDLETGALWVGDVGQSAWEEVDVAPADSRGLDFGWHRWEGGHCYDPPTGCDPTGVTMPVTEYGHDVGCAIIGGVVYRGDAIPALRGAYLFSDNCSGTLWAIDAGLDAVQTPTTLLETGRSISSIGIDDAGEVYLTDLAGGELLRLVAG